MEDFYIWIILIYKMGNFLGYISRIIILQIIMLNFKVAFYIYIFRYKFRVNIESKKYTLKI